MVRSVVPAGLENPRIAIGDETLMFDELLGWGAREAISKRWCRRPSQPLISVTTNTDIYEENVKTLTQEKIIDVVQVLNDRADE